jgi:hypothetical protein
MSIGTIAAIELRHNGNPSSVDRIWRKLTSDETGQLTEFWKATRAPILRRDDLENLDALHKRLGYGVHSIERGALTAAAAETLWEDISALTRAMSKAGFKRKSPVRTIAGEKTRPSPTPLETAIAGEIERQQAA